MLFVRSAVADVTFDHDQSRTVISMEKGFIGTCQHSEVIRIAQTSDVSTIAEKPASDVLCECDIGRPLDGHVIVVIDPTEVRKLEAPASDAASPLMPSIMQPSPQGA